MRSNSLVALWGIAKALQIPIDGRVKELTDLPYTISYIIRKRQQIDNLNELPKDKKPSAELIFASDSNELEDFLDRVLDSKPTTGLSFLVSDIE